MRKRFRSSSELWHALSNLSISFGLSPSLSRYSRCSSFSLVNAARPRAEDSKCSPSIEQPFFLLSILSSSREGGIRGFFNPAGRMEGTNITRLNSTLRNDWPQRMISMGKKFKLTNLSSRSDGSCRTVINPFTSSPCLNSSPAPRTSNFSRAVSFLINPPSI